MFCRVSSSRRVRFLLCRPIPMTTALRMARTIRNSGGLAAFLLEKAHIAAVPGVAFEAPDDLRLTCASSMRDYRGDGPDGALPPDSAIGKRVKRWNSRIFRESCRGSGCLCCAYRGGQRRAFHPRASAGGRGGPRLLHVDQGDPCADSGQPLNRQARPLPQTKNQGQEKTV